MDCGAFLKTLKSRRFRQSVHLPAELVAGFADGLYANGVALALFDPDDVLVFAGKMFSTLYAVPAGQPRFSDIMRHCHAIGAGPIFTNPDIDEWLRVANQRRRSQPRRHFEVDLVDGRWLLATETTYGEGWVLLTLTDITVLKASERTLRFARDAAIKAAETDFLTGLYNRRRMMGQLAEAAECSDQTGGPLSIILIDLDHFKVINDAYGHGVGDKVLCAFAERAKAGIRHTDTLGRVGGEEFLVIAPSPNAEAVRTADRLRIRVARSRPVPGIDLRYTMSAGVASWQCGDSADSLYHRADQALYAAKRAGRNCVRASGEHLDQASVA